MANLAALRAAVFFAICEKPQGGGLKSTPPPPVRGLNLSLNHCGRDAIVKFFGDGVT